MRTLYGPQQTAVMPCKAPLQQLTCKGWLTPHVLCSNIEKEKQRSEQAAKDVKAKAKAMAVALQTIGKFVIKKKVGENNKIFGR